MSLLGCEPIGWRFLVKVGDLVRRANYLVRDSLGTGVIVKAIKSDEYAAPYYQVSWSRGVDLFWYDGPELEVISEA